LAADAFTFQALLDIFQLLAELLNGDLLLELKEKRKN
jgi:hypothetical protein